MKKLGIILIYIFILPFFILGQNVSKYKGQVVNQIDINGFKQGLWVEFDEISLVAKYEDPIVIAEGNYKDDKKEGIWIGYYNTGLKKSQITFKDGIPNGEAIFYYENGIVKEEGIWIEDNWVGEYRYYYENANPAYIFFYDSTGNRVGQQKYFYPNGYTKMEGYWEGGKENGVLKKYHEKDGSLKSEEVFNNGRNDKTKIKTYQIGQVPPKSKYVKEVDYMIKEVEGKLSKSDLASLQDNKSIKVYQKDTKQLLYEGVFENGKFKNGYKYTYYPTGQLKRKETFKNFKLVNKELFE